VKPLKWFAILLLAPLGKFASINGQTLTSLYSFSRSDGGQPVSGLVQGNDGNFYGTTTYGGPSTNCPFGCGTVFQISLSGTLTNLHLFSGYPSDGGYPYAVLVQGSDGSFYGTTESGGANNSGTVFRISPSGSFTNLHFFSGSDGGLPVAGLVQGSDGNFYGTTEGGGANNDGTVFQISPSGTFTNLHSFSGYPSDGGHPYAPLLQGSDGNFYGTTYSGGTSNLGSAFRISPGSSFTNLYFFSGSDGGHPYAGVIQGSDGNFYGTTSAGGASTNCSSGCGIVFTLFVSLNPPANQISAIQLSDANIVITIPSVACETYQLQFTADLTSGIWSNIPNASVTNSIGALLKLTNFGGALQPQGFYRFNITP
jgi:uncharacterized repeat protein (TIGR03803 family)